MNKLLMVVDSQIDFIGGSLSVNGAAEVMDALANYIHEYGGQYDYRIVTNDWHPLSHCSFKENGGTWPMHCVQYSMGAAIYPGLIEPLFDPKFVTKVLTKGNLPKVEEYSIFKNSTSASHIKLIMGLRNIQQIDLCGIAGDYCVLDTLKDGIELYGKDMFNVLMPYIASIDGGKALNDFINENSIKATY